MKIQDIMLDRLVIASSLLEIENDEVWREIDFLPEAETQSRYFVSNYGSVISLCRNIPIVLQPFLCGDIGVKYYCVSICGKDYKIHRLVAQAFLPNPEEKPIVHLKAHNKFNIHWSNLEWATAKENAIAYQKHKANTTEK